MATPPIENPCCICTKPLSKSLNYHYLYFKLTLYSLWDICPLDSSLKPKMLKNYSTSWETKFRGQMDTQAEGSHLLDTL